MINNENEFIDAGAFFKYHASGDDKLQISQICLQALRA